MNTTGSLPAASPLRPHNTLEARDTAAIPGRVWPAGLLVGSLMVLARWVAPLPGGPRRAASAAQPSHDEPPPLPQRRHLSGPRPALIARASRSAPTLTAEGGTMRRPCYVWFRTMVAVVLLSLLAAACSTSPEARAWDCGATETRSGAPALDTAALDDYIARLMPEYDIPGLGLAVVRDGKIAYTRSYGVRDTTTGAPVTPDTQFAIASITKSFTARGWRGFATA
jgi:hypothetical protein